MRDLEQITIYNLLPERLFKDITDTSQLAIIKISILCKVKNNKIMI